MSDAHFSAKPVLDGLMGFQRQTVEHVFSRLHDEGGSGRFLVADETGLGKSIVARGLVAKTVERLQDDPEVDRIDIVYVCSNMDLARQNIGRLNVTAEEEIAFSSRLTLLGKHSARLNNPEGRSTVSGKLVNLISFTPSTSFDPGHTMGQAEERALLALVLEEVLGLDRTQMNWTSRLLQGRVNRIATFRDRIARLRDEADGRIDPQVVKDFRRFARAGRPNGPSSLTRFKHLLSDTMQARGVNAQLRHRIPPLVGLLRRDLAHAGISTLQPDLVLLDEFQRFRVLLSRDNDAGELAHDLFSSPDAKVALLSATPYKPFTYAEEEEDHAADFLRTIRFLHDEAADESPSTAEVSADLAAYRNLVTTGGDAQEAADAASQRLLQVMSRNERPRIEERSMLDERVVPTDDLAAEDLVGWVRLKELSTIVDSRMSLVSVDYWKSAPYFLSFSNGYRLRQRIKEQAVNPTPQLRSALRATPHLTKKHVEDRMAIDWGNARLRRLAEDFVDTGVWRLLWMPPSLPYLEPAGVYAGWDHTDLTKRLVFSSWTATPASVASLLSHEVTRRVLGPSSSAESERGQRLIYRGASEHGRPQSMTTLMLFWPMPGLAEQTDPRSHARTQPSLTTERLVAASAGAIGDTFAGDMHLEVPEDDTAHRVWHAALAHDSSWPAHAGVNDFVAAMSPTAKSSDVERQRDEQAAAKASENMRLHVDFARDLNGAPALRAEEVLILAEVGAFSPANISWRVLRRLLREEDAVTADGVMLAAAALAGGLRTLFNTPHATALVRSAHNENRVDPYWKQDSSGRIRPYWRQVLEYCANGNLEATLEEWLFNRRNEDVHPWADDTILAFARDEAAAMSLRTSTLTAFDPNGHDTESSTVRFPVRFAVRYGARDTHGGDDARMPEVRASFNSPFWPFVLVSTSVGQEGIDFHWWCHSLLHWNTPSNPADFEQREGRIDRFRGHAIRKNIALKHGDAAIRSAAASPWRELFELATDLRAEHGDFTPDWVYPGPAKIQRHVVPYALSSDEPRYEKVNRDVALYRLTLGQPRQEDMLALLRDQYDDSCPPAQITLVPPSTGSRTPNSIRLP